MNNNLGVLYAFLGGAIVGAGVALLLAPEKGEDLRKRIQKLLKKHGVSCCDDEVDDLVEQLIREIEEKK